LSSTHNPPPLFLFPYTTLFRSHSKRLVGRDWPGPAALRPVAPDFPAPERLPGLAADSGSAHCLDLGLGLFPSGLAHFGFARVRLDRKSTRLNSSHLGISYAVFC